MEHDQQFIPKRVKEVGNWRLFAGLMLLLFVVM
jgi:hypothetical protein